KIGDDTADLALRDLSLSIQSGEKVAICGRSGSGKSSTVLLLLRLLDPISGTSDGGQMYIDDVPLHRIDRQTLRQRIIAVPQESVFLPDGSSIRSNLDPFLVATDADCREVLERVGLWHPFVSERQVEGEGAADGKAGLDAGMNADMLSQGQKQLFSLARAMVRRRTRAKIGAEGGILLLDEISSSVDVVTDRDMQQIIQEEFVGYTILMVSHRLEMVMDFDKVIVMERGAVVETGAPRVLAEARESRFRSLWLTSHSEKD
ncbi:P-loop containing nucleoside triphosphate hydrolase protein, partial [Coniella lustricola]